MKKSREAMINTLVERDVDTIRQCLDANDTEYLECVLRGDGFTPYESLTEIELLQEYDDYMSDRV